MISMKRVVVLGASLIALSAVAGSTQAAHTQQPGYVHAATPAWLEAVPAERYVYGMKLDIAKVVYVSDTRNVCGPVEATMHYRDSSGELRALEYRVLGGGCVDH